MNADFYLASKSPRRAQLLKDWGYNFKVLQSSNPDSTDESVLPGESAADYVQRVTIQKARWGLNFLKDNQLKLLPVLAADTTVVYKDTILGKPSSAEEAYEFLHMLSGTTHKVLTAVAVANDEGIDHLLNVTDVCFDSISDDELWAYINSGEPFDKAGGYGIQGKAGAFIKSICGSFSGVMGLPQYETAKLLTKHKISMF